MNAPEHLPLERPAIDGAQYLPINLCEAASFNPRKRFDPAKLEELANSIEKLGVMQPVLARPKPGAKRGGALYEIIAGERRLRACKLVAERRKEVDIAVIPAVVRDLTDFEARELATTENLQRDDLHPLEEAEGYEGLLLKPVTGGEFKPPRTRGYSVDELAARIGKSRGYVFGRLKLLALIPEGREAFFEGKLSASVALRVARMPAKVQEKALPQLLQGWGGEPYSDRAAADFLHRNYMLALKGAVFDIADAKLVPKAGSCHACPKRTGASPDLFDDVKSADTCTDPACFEAKAKAHGEQQLEQAREKGLQVLTGQAAKKVMPYGEYSLGQTGHVNLDKPAEELTGTRKNLRTLLGDDFKGTVLVKGDHMDQPMAVATEAEVKAALKAKGLLKPSTKSKPGQPAKALTADDIKKQRKHRVRTMMVERAPGHLWKHLQQLGGATFTVPVYMRLIRAVSYGLYEIGLADILDAAGLHKKGTGALSDDEMMALLAKQPDTTLADLLLMCLMSDHLENDTQEQDLEELADEIDWPVHKLLEDVEHEVDTAIRDEIEALKAAVPKTKPAVKAAAGKAAAVRYRDPATLQTWSGRGLQPKWLKAALEQGKTLADFEVNRAPSETASTPPIPAAAQGAKTAQKTPEQALAEAVTKEQAAAPAAKKKTSQKDKPAAPAPQAPRKASKPTKAASQKDKAASPPAEPPAAQLSGTAAWPFPKQPAASGATQAAEHDFRVGDSLRVKADAPRAKTRVRVGKVDAIGDGQVTLRWGPRSHEIGVYPFDQVEHVLDAAAAWPMPEGAAA